MTGAPVFELNRLDIEDAIERDEAGQSDVTACVLAALSRQVKTAGGPGGSLEEQLQALLDEWLSKSFLGPTESGGASDVVARCDAMLRELDTDTRVLREGDTLVVCHNGPASAEQRQHVLRVLSEFGGPAIVLPYNMRLLQGEAAAMAVRVAELEAGIKEYCAKNDACNIAYDSATTEKYERKRLDEELDEASTRLYELVGLAEV